MRRLPTINEYVSDLHPVLRNALGDTFQKAVAEGQVMMLASDGSLQGQHDATQGWKLFCRQDHKCMGSRGGHKWKHRYVLFPPSGD